MSRSSRLSLSGNWILLCLKQYTSSSRPLQGSLSKLTQTALQPSNSTAVRYAESGEYLLGEDILCDSKSSASLCADDFSRQAGNFCETRKQDSPYPQFRFTLCRDQREYELNEARDPGSSLICLNRTGAEWEQGPIHCVPTVKKPGLGPMAGGNYVIAPGSRYREVTGVRYPIPVHDRFESKELNEVLSVYYEEFHAERKEIQNSRRVRSGAETILSPQKS